MDQGKEEMEWVMCYVTLCGDLIERADKKKRQKALDITSLCLDFLQEKYFY